jgi:LacI family transcriptional regulator
LISGHFSITTIQHLKPAVETSCSIVDVARVAGVGVGTVSRVLNHAPNVHPDTAAQVHAAVARLGYRLPSRKNRRGPRRGRQTASSLRAGSEIMVIILGPQGLDWMLHCAPVYAGVLHGIEAEVADKGLRLTMRQALDWNHVGRALEPAAPAGLIFLGFEPDSDTKSELASQALQVPAVWTMGSPLAFHGDHVQPDHSKVGILAARHLLERGHRRCAVIGTRLGAPDSLMNFRNDSFQWTIAAAGGKAEMLLDPALVVRSRSEHLVEKDRIRGVVKAFSQIKPRPTALFVESDILIPPIYQQLIAHGIAPQQDVELVTCNNERPYLSMVEPKLTVVDIQPQALGRRTVDQLLWRIANLNAPAMRIMVAPVLVANAPAFTPKA